MRSDIFNVWMDSRIKNNYNASKVKSFTLNFGPQHPASHGVLRLILQLSGELIERADPHIGFLHRGTEKLVEGRGYLQSLPYLDRLDYVSMMSQEHSFVLAIEDLMETTSYTSIYTQIRVLFDELTRLLNHFLGLATHSLDVGNMSPVFWAFEERERLMEFYERVSGARMHAAFYRPNEVDWSGINYQLFVDISLFARDSFKSITEIFILLSTNKIWKSRLINVGSLGHEEALKYGASGVILRSTGEKKDLRFLRSDCYSFYWFLQMQSYLGKRGDCYDRFLIRIREMYESINIVFQLIAALVSSNSGFSTKSKGSSFQFYHLYNFIFNKGFNKNFKNTKHNSMESLIEHFKYYSCGLEVPKGFSYKAVEAPKGEFGVSIISDGSSMPHRCKFRSPAFHHLCLMARMVHGHLFADMITILGSQDIVFGEVDR